MVTLNKKYIQRCNSLYSAQNIYGMQVNKTMATGDSVFAYWLAGGGKYSSCLSPYQHQYVKTHWIFRNRTTNIRKHSMKYLNEKDSIGIGINILQKPSRKNVLM
jgi:hypothetical protein